MSSAGILPAVASRRRTSSPCTNLLTCPAGHL